MSGADAERIRRAYEVWNESGPAAVTDQFWAEDAVYREGPGWPDAGVYRGRAAALERMRSLIEVGVKPRLVAVITRTPRRVGRSIRRALPYVVVRALREMPAPISRTVAPPTPPALSKSLTLTASDRFEPRSSVPRRLISMRLIREISCGWVKSPTLSPSSVAATRQ